MAAESQQTADGRYLLINGRRWRRTDPAVPEKLRVELVAELMGARRAVRDAKGDPETVAVARSRVQDAKVALGERGEPWWEPATGAGLATRLEATMLALLRARDADRTICPSDAARVAGGTSWRSAMDAARAVATELADGGVLEVRQRGQRVDPRTARGPLRLARGPSWPEDSDGT